MGDTLWMPLQRAWADDRAWVLLPVVRKENIRDLNLELAAQDGYALGKVAGLAIFKDRSNWASMDNDGVDDSSSETFFWKIGT